MQTAYHMMALVRQLQNEIVGGKIINTEFYKKERTAIFFIKKDKTNALVFSYHPTRHGIYLVPASKIKIKTREKPWPIFKLEGAIIDNITQFNFDRILKVSITSDKNQTHLMCEGLGPNGNIWLLDENQIKTATLRKRDISKNEIYAIPPLKDKLNPLEMNSNQLANLIINNKDTCVNYLIEKNILGCSRRLSDEIIKRADLEFIETDEINSDNIDSLLKTFKNISDLFKNADKGYLYNFNGFYDAYPFKLSSVEIQPDKFKTLSLAVMEMALNRHFTVEKKDSKKIALDAFKKAIKKIEKRIKNIESDIKDATDYEQYKKYGELIQINIGSMKKGLEKIELDDIYNDANLKITIKLDPAKTPAANAEVYFKKHRKGREGLELMKRRLEISQEELKNNQIISAELEDNFENASQKYKQELDSLFPKEQTKQVQPVRLPYKEYQLSTGLTIFVGRDGSDNDRTTFEFAKPYELWFHAQQCPGSHVVIKFPNKNFVPSKLEIEQTAAVAAFYSKARKNSLVPVIYTEKKYVRKPRKAKAGLVIVEREKSVLVEPTNPEDF